MYLYIFYFEFLCLRFQKDEYFQKDQYKKDTYLKLKNHNDRVSITKLRLSSVNFLMTRKYVEIQKQLLEVFYKKGVFKISQNSEESICARVSFLIKWQVSGTGVFLWILRNFWENLFLRNTSAGCFWILTIENSEKEC